MIADIDGIHRLEAERGEEQPVADDRLRLYPGIAEGPEMSAAGDQRVDRARDIRILEHRNTVNALGQSEPFHQPDEPG